MILGCALSLGACSSSSGNSGAGGMYSTAGMLTGGTSSTGGVLATGGSKSTGGASATGGSVSVGGVSATGGSSAMSLTDACTVMCGIWANVNGCPLTAATCVASCTHLAQTADSASRYTAMVVCEAQSLDVATDYFCSGVPLIASDNATNSGSGPAPSISYDLSSPCKQQICDYTCNESYQYDPNVCTVDACRCTSC